MSSEQYICDNCEFPNDGGFVDGVWTCPNCGLQLPDLAEAFESFKLERKE